MSQDNKEFDLSGLKPPTSPGFTILDITPNSIERPKTARELTVSTVNLINQDLTIPKNFAFEIVPSWLVSRNKLSFSRITGLKTIGNTTKQNWLSDVKFTSISIASVYNESGNTQLLQANTNHIGYGFKTNLIKVYGRKRLKAIGETIETITKVSADPLSEIDPDEPRKRVANEIRTNTKDLWKRVIDFRTIRPNFQLQLAGASSLAFPNNTDGQHHRSGGWLTFVSSKPLFKIKDDDGKELHDTVYAKKLLENKNFLNFIFLGRVINSKFDSVYLDKAETLVDLGARMEFELDRLLMGVEFINRTGNNNFNNTHRLAGMVEYKIHDNLYLIGSFGRNFGEYNNVVSLLGLNWGFGSNSIFKPLKLDVQQ